MNLVEYTPKASLSPMPASIRFLGDGYEVVVREGANTFSDEEYSNLQANPDVKTIYKDVIHFRGRLSKTPSEPLPKDDEPEVLSDLSDVKGEDLDKTIDEQSNIATLEKWLVSEQRITVKRKLNERIAELKG